MSFAPAALTLGSLRARGEPQLFDRDTRSWKTRLVAWFEAASGRTLYPDQTEMFLVEMLAYVMAMHGESAQAAVIQNLAVWATGRNLDDVAANLSIFRLLAQRAVTRFRFTLAAARPSAVLVPNGTVVSNDTVAFATIADVTIPAGSLTADADATAIDAGAAANGFLPGQLARPLSSIAPGLTGANITTSSGGSDAESDEHLRESAVDAAESFDRRGGWGGYGLFVRRFNPAFVDVAIDRPAPGHIHVVPMIAGDAAPGTTLLNQLRGALDPETVTPQGDYVTVRAPTPTDFTVTLQLKVDPLASGAAIAAEVEARVRAAFAAMRRPLLSGSRQTQFAPETGRLGAQVAPGPLVAAAMAVPGVVDASVSGLVFTDLAFDRYPRMAGLTINQTGVPDA